MDKTYEPIATQTLGSTVNSVTFGSIPQTYTDLVLIFFVQDNASGSTFANAQIQFNGDTGSNYSWLEMYGNGTSAVGQSANNNTTIWGGYISTVSGVFSANSMQIMNYSNTTTFKSTIGRANLGVTSPNTTTVTEAIVGCWRNTNAISSIKINSANAGTLFSVGSTFTLYGIKAA